MYLFERKVELAFLAISKALCLPLIVSAQVRYQTIAISGLPAPGTGEGVDYHSFEPPAINDIGQVSYISSLAGNGVTSLNNRAIYVSGTGSPKLVVRSGEPVPGTEGVDYLNFSRPILSHGGEVAFSAQLRGSGVTVSTDTANCAGQFTSPQMLTREGSPAAGVGPGVRYGPFFTSASMPLLNDVGQVAFLAQLEGSGITNQNNLALYIGDLTAPVLAVQSGDAAPHAGPGANRVFLNRPSLNDAGHVAYTALLGGAGVTPENDWAIYGGDAASPLLVAREGNAAPGAGTGVTYGDFTLVVPTLNDAGHIAYTVLLRGNEVTTTNNRALFGGTLAAPQLVAREGDPAPGGGANVTYLDLSSFPSLNDVGQVAFGASLVGPGVTAVNDSAIYAGEFNNPLLVARAGDPAPGTAIGINYGLLEDSPAFNDLGQLAFHSRLTGADVATANDGAVFLYDPLLGTFLVAREGNLFDIGGGDLRTITDNGIHFLAGTNDDSLTGFSNEGRLALYLAFTDGSRGVFVAAIPEPALVSLGGIVILLMHRQRKRDRDGSLLALSQPSEVRRKFARRRVAHARRSLCACLTIGHAGGGRLSWSAGRCSRVMPAGTGRSRWAAGGR